MRRFSRSNSIHNNQAPQSPPTSYTPPLSHAPMLPNGTGSSHHDSRPVSANTASSFDFANRPPVQYHMNTLPSNVVGNLSRTDQIVLRHFWESKYAENKARDLHFVRTHCSLTSTVRPRLTEMQSSNFRISHNTPATRISFHIAKSITWSRRRRERRYLAWVVPTVSTSGKSSVRARPVNGRFHTALHGYSISTVSIPFNFPSALLIDFTSSFELFSGSQLHIDMDDAWHNISHHRVSFKSYEKMLKDPASDAAFKSWPKPLTIEFLEEQYQRWMLDLTAFCWDTEEVTELGSAAGGGSVHGDMKGEML